MKYSLRFIFVVLSIIATTQISVNAQSKYVNPFIGTNGHGHTYPGVCLPFGMVQLSPDTRLEGWDGCSGYHYTDKIIYGFSHTHLSGTGCSDYGDILMMPTTGEIKLKNIDYASPFKKADEVASAGYYAVLLEKYDVGVELTATPRVGFHRYVYPAGNSSNVIIDLTHRDEVIESSIEIIDNKEIRGLRRSKNWADDQYVYFVIRFSKKFNSFGIAEDDNPVKGKSSAQGKKLKAWVTFKTDEKEAIYAKVGISAVDINGALKNLEKEINGWDFTGVRKNAVEAWDKELGKIKVEGSEDDKTNFYTALYHCMIVPNLYMDVDRRYRGRDLKIHTAEGFENYTVFSLWDTYRAEHPLLSIIDQKRTNDFIQTFIRQYEEGGRLPVWELAANETFCMIGYHSVPVIVDAYMKGIRKYDVNKAFEAMKHSATESRTGINYLEKYGYVPGDLEHESVSKTLEYAYDDWCISKLAKILNKDEDYLTFIRRAQFYKNIYDSKTTFMRSRINGGWFKPFEPSEVNNHYTEANSWQYTFYVPQDITGFAGLLGGMNAMSLKLDELFTTSPKISGRDQPDITGLIGQYAHGNEPSHHMAYLFDYTGDAWKTQQRVKQIMYELYLPKPDGLCGNEDCGQMSAWYVLSAMGFYQVCPGDMQYAIGSPLFDRCDIHLENGKTFTLTAKNLSRKNVFIQSATLNGQPYNKCFFKHEDLMNGGELSFVMGPLPSSLWGMGESALPVSTIRENHIVPVPVIDAPYPTFQDSMYVNLYQAEKDKIFYTLDGSIPDNSSQVFTKTIMIKNNITINAISWNPERGYSLPVSATYTKIPSGRRIQLFSNYENQYTAGGPLALIDGLKGSVNWRIGRWQGYLGLPFEAVVEFDKLTDISEVSLGCLQDISPWIWFPKEVQFSYSEDGQNYFPLGTVKNDVPDTDTRTQVKDFSVSAPNGKVKAISVKIKAINYGIIPSWHEGAGKQSHMFVDEITIE